MNNSFSAAATGRATTTRRFFSRETTVAVQIAAPPAVVWALLTDAADYTRWNSTVTMLQGEIAPGGQLALKSILDEKRVFRLQVKEFAPEKRLVWGDSQGSRVYELIPAGPNQTRFTMTEKIGGPFFPLFARFIPPFDEVFNQFAADLKEAAEAAA